MHAKLISSSTTNQQPESSRDINNINIQTIADKNSKCHTYTQTYQVVINKLSTNEDWDVIQSGSRRTRESHDRQHRGYKL